MKKFRCLLFVLKGSYIRYYIICMTVSLTVQICLEVSFYSYCRLFTYLLSLRFLIFDKGSREA